MASAAVERTMAVLAAEAVAGRATTAGGGGTSGRDTAGRANVDDESGASIVAFAPAFADSAVE